MVCLEDAHKMSLTAQKWETYRFTSKEFDRETGLYYYGARYYEPKLSNWMSADPAGFELINPMEQGDEGLQAKEKYSVIESTNWYSYVSNNPVWYVDPTGMWELKVGLSVGGFAMKARIANVDGEWDVDVAAGVGLGGMLKFDFSNESSQISNDTPEMTLEVSGNLGVESGPFAGLNFEGQAVIDGDGHSVKGKISGNMPNQGGALSPFIQFDTKADPKIERNIEVNTDVGFDAMLFAGFGTNQDEW